MRNKHISIKLAVLALAVAGFTGAMASVPAHAASRGTSATMSLKSANAAITSSSAGRFHAVSTFPGPDGLTGAVISPVSSDHDSERAIAWLTPKGEAIIVNGMVFDRKGGDLSQEAMFEQGLLLHPVDVLKQAALPGAHGIVVGKTGPMLTIFFDPNCVYCHLMYKQLMPKVAAGKVRVRFIAVGTLKESSIPKSVSILASTDPAKALELDEAKFNPSTEEGGYPVDKQLDPALKAVVEANNALFTKAGARGTPATLYCAVSDHTVKMRPGMPQDLDALIAGAGDCD